MVDACSDELRPRTLCRVSVCRLQVDPPSSASDGGIDAIVRPFCPPAMTSTSTEAAESPRDENSYGQIVKSSSVMGGVAAVTLIFSMVRTKFAAVLIGTTGVGLLANFVAVQTFIATLAALGIGSSAVRDIAKAYADDDGDQIGRTVLTLRRACWFTGVLGAGSMAVLSSWLSQLTFGSNDYAWHIAGLGLAILFGILQSGQTALLQGSRRIAQLARLQVGAAAVGALVSLVLFFFLGVDGLVPALVLAAAINLGLAWYFARQVPVPVVEMSYRESFQNVKSMARLGFAMMFTGLAGSATIYAINALITQEMGVAALGIYSAGFALSGVFANFVLSAMLCDYYPRLSAASDDHVTLNRLVNEQTEVAVLLAAPGLVATMTLAPWMIHILYTGAFLPAIELLEWFTLGCLGRVISWPLGYLLLAKSRGGSHIACEVTAHAMHILLVFLGIRYLGLTGAAAAFFVLYILYTGMVFMAGRHLTGFAWNGACGRQIGIAAAFILAAWLVAQIDSLAVSTALGIPCIAIAALHSLTGLTTRLGSDHRLTRTLLSIPFLKRVAGGQDK